MSLPRTKTRSDVVREVLREYALDRGWRGLPKLFAKGCLLIWHARAHRRWLAVIGGTATRRVLVVEPRTAYRHSSKYLFAGLRWKDRIALMSAHYAFLNRTHDAAFFDTVLTKAGLPLWELDEASERVTIVLLGPPHHREGDLRLHVRLNGETVFKAAFSIVPVAFFLEDAQACGKQVVYIGQVQGAAGQLEAIRRVTKRCKDIAPPDLLMSTLAGLARAWGIDHFLSAGEAIHHSAFKLSQAMHPFDYAEFWERYHARLLPAGHYLIEVPFPQKPLMQIVGRHRKRVVVKRAFKQALGDEVAARITLRLDAVRSSARDVRSPWASRRTHSLR